MSSSKLENYNDLEFCLEGGLDYSGRSMTNIHVSHKEIKACSFFNSDLSNSCFCGVTFDNVDFSHSNLSGSEFIDCTFGKVLFCGADLTKALFHNCDLFLSDLSGANLSDSRLLVSASDSKFSFANFHNANFYRSHFGMGVEFENIINTETSEYFNNIPQGVDLAGWKKCENGVIVKLLIPADAKRSIATTDKCRAEYVEVLDVYGDLIGTTHWPFLANSYTHYVPGHYVWPINGFDDNRWNGCSSGIHFFLTRKEAEAYLL